MLLLVKIEYSFGPLPIYYIYSNYGIRCDGLEMSRFLVTTNGDLKFTILQLLYKTRTKIKNVKPNKTTCSAENIVFSSVKNLLVAVSRVPTAIDYFVSNPLYLGLGSKIYNLIKMVMPRLIFRPLSRGNLHMHIMKTTC